MGMGSRLFCAFFVGAVATRPSEVHAGFVIDFENFNLGGGLFLDVPELLTFPNAGGSNITVAIQGNADNRIYDLFLFGGNPVATGQALIDWHWPSGSNPAGTTILFDQAISFFSLEAGDFGGDDDSPMQITAFDANDVVIGSDSVPWPATAHPPFATLSVQASGIRKIHFSSGGSFANSVFIDNLTFVPAPSALALLTLAGLMGTRRRRR